ncbi:MAG: class I SAM-dependent rRNA methyltransferase [Prevotella sp.]|nr:class I SAM-dependent rRNA methyltransferase [Prevotella sp.]
MYKTIQLKRGKEESLLRFHPWIFSGAVKHADNGIEEGEIVRVVSENADFIANGHYQQGSIAVRVLSFDDVPIDDNFWAARLASALQMRQALGLALPSPTARTTAYRLVHGEGDHLPGLIIDIYGQTAVMQAHSIGMHNARHAIAKALMDVMGDNLSSIYYKSETTLPFMANSDGFIVGNSIENTAMENGLQFYIDWLKGQKTGFFVDQRDNRLLVEHYAHDRRVLNMFCYTGGFSVYAVRGGAQLVHSVDSSAKAIELTRQNVALNFPDDNRHEAFCEDAFRFLEKASGEGSEAYDLIILDPPAFAKHRAALHNALKGYTRLNNKAFEKIAKGGILFTFSCSQVVTKDHFRNAVFTAAAQARRKVRILHQLHQPADHPINIYHPEGEYLKGLVLYVE